MYVCMCKPRQRKYENICVYLLYCMCTFFESSRSIFDDCSDELIFAPVRPGTMGFMK